MRRRPLAIHAFQFLDDGTTSGRTRCQSFPARGTQAAPVSMDETVVTCERCRKMLAGRKPEAPQVNYDLVLAFDSDDPEFMRGFEAGQVYARAMLRRADEAFTAQVHTSNSEMMLRIAEATSRVLVAVDFDGDFMGVEFSPKH